MIHLVIGRQGSGKTLLLVKKAYEYHKSGKTVYSNVHLNFPYKKIDYNDIVNCVYENAIVIIDEIHQLIPSRNAMSKRNREICDSFLSMVRKKGLILYGSTQTERKVDIRMREESDFVTECEKYIYKNKKFHHVVQSRTFPKKIPIIIKLKVFDTYTSNILETSFRGNYLFDMFDTKQIIRITGLDIDKDKKEKRKKKKKKKK